MKDLKKPLFGIAMIAMLSVGLIACGSKKHTPCESYGNKSGQVDVPYNNEAEEYAVVSKTENESI